MRLTPLLPAIAVLLGASPVRSYAEAWSFGVLGDTQWAGTDPTGKNINTVAVNQINAANAQFVAAGVDFVIQVGDLGDNGSNASLQTRLDTNSLLNAAGIEFYGLRGNHESSGTAKTFFQQNYLPSSGSAANVSVWSGDGATYSVTRNGTKVVLLDYGVTGNTTLLNGATSWMNGELAANDHTQAFVFGHKNLLGQNHKDNLFGSGNESNPTQQNAFISTLDTNNVRYYISGHDHMHHRSEVVSPNGSSSVQQIISASDSYKYYDPTTPYSTRETPYAQQLDKTGYYIYTVDGPRVTGKYFATTPLANGDVPANPTWSLEERFGYSLNGTSKQVARGQSYVLTHSIGAGTSYGENGYRGTSMAILSGTNGSTATAGGRATSKDLNIGWAPITNGPEGARSDVLTMWGMSDIGQGDRTDTFTLSLSFDASGLSLSSLQAGDWGILSLADGATSWVNAVARNYGSTNQQFIFGAWNSGYGLGTYGIDMDASGGPVAWAVVNNATEFTVGMIPEPSLYAAFLGLATAAVGFLRRRRSFV